MSARLFFGLWPDAASVRALGELAEQARNQCGGRIMQPGNLHLTLAFLGQVEKARITQLQALLHEFSWQSGPLSLDRYGSFRGPRIVWAGPGACPLWLDELYQGLWRQLEPMGFRPENRFRPHVSLLRGASGADLVKLSPFAPVDWTPDDFRLVASRPQAGGSLYQVLAQAPLPANAL